MIDFAGDLDQLISPSDFAVQATWEGNEIPVVFDLAHEPIETNLGVIEGLGPRAMVKSADVDGIAHGDVLVIPVEGVQTQFKVVGIEPDGRGLTTLVLMEV